MSGVVARPEGGAVLALAGPTAVGKSEVALELAEALNGEIISVDSMQVYRGLDIGTAKPSREQRARVPHHLIDILDITANFDAAQFVSLAHNAAQEIRARGRLPILCGGTGLYFKAFFAGLGAAPAGSDRLRRELEAVPLTDLLSELARLDPITFRRIDQKNPRRIIRALEVIRLTGRPYSDQRASWSGEKTGGALVGLARASADLHQRIEARVEQMFAQGLVAETRALVQAGLEHNRTAAQALGYRQVVEHLHGDCSLPETIALVKIRTRQFAKRQMTWFRKQLPTAWLEISKDEPAAATAARVMELSGKRAEIEIARPAPEHGRIPQ